MKINKKVIILHNMGHISGEEGVKKFPLLLKELESF